MISRQIKNQYKQFIEIAKGLKGEYQTGRAFHVTVITNKRKILTIGINDYTRQIIKTDVGLYKIFGEDSYKPCTHSEIDALRKLKLKNYSKLSYFNIRIDNNGEPSSSKPCKNCLYTLARYGFKQIWFLNKNNELTCIKNRNLIV